MSDRYFPNDHTNRQLPSSPHELLQRALEALVVECPPKAEYGPDDLCGIFLGYTSVAFLFLQLSARKPDLIINGRSLREWAVSYNQGTREYKPLSKKTGCGIVNETLSHRAMTACLSGKTSDVHDFLSVISTIPCDDNNELTKEFPSELIYGRAGALYLLRLVAHWVPSSKESVQSHTKRLSDRIMEDNDHGASSWIFFGRPYIGAGHGDIGNIVQLVLSTPTLAPILVPQVQKLLTLQLADGNWPKFSNEQESNLVQWCHGAPGFIMCLQRLKPFMPELAKSMDEAISKGQQAVWDKGLLKKSPNLCHGILGNAL